MIPISDLKKQVAPIRAEIDEAIKKVIDNTSFICGKEVEDFENEVVKYCGVKSAVGVSNGTDAIRLALLASGVKAGDGVICPTFTYYATAGAIAAMGAVPVFADIDPDTYNISLKSVEEALNKNVKKLKIKAIVPVHLYGQCADMDGVLRIAKDNKIKVVEDTAQAFGADYYPGGDKSKVKKAGTMGDCGSISFFPGKNLGAFGDAGMVMTNDNSIGETLKILRNQGNKEKYVHLLLGFNNRLDTIQAAVLKVKLKYIDSWNNKRQEIAAFFNRELKGLPVKTPFVAKYSTHIYHQYVLRLETSSDKMIQHLRDKGIDSRVYYPIPLHQQECLKYLGYKNGDFPESEKAAIQTFAVPVYPDLTDEEKDHIVGSIKEFLK